MFLLALKIVLQISDFRVHFNFSFQESDNLYKEIHKSLHLCIIFVRKLDMKCREFNSTLDVASVTVMLLKRNRFHTIVHYEIFTTLGRKNSEFDLKPLNTVYKIYKRPKKRLKGTKKDKKYVWVLMGFEPTLVIK